MRMRRLLVLLSGLMAVQPASIEAQTRPLFGVGLIREAYGFSDATALGIESLTLISTPIAFRAALGPRASLDVAGAYARGTLRRSDGSEAVLSGLTDTQITISASVVPDMFTLSAIALAPTGKQKHTDAEADVAGAVSADLLPFRISNWSTGGGLGLGSSLTHSTGTVGMGVSVSYVVGREFDLFETEEFALRPGNQLILRGVLDIAVGAAGKLSAQLTFQQASEDQVNGSAFDRPGKRFNAIASYSFRAGAAASGSVYGGLLHRASNVYLESALTAAAEDLLLAGGGLRVPLRGAVLQPSVDLRILRRSDGTGQGYLMGAGTSLEWLRPGGLTLVPSVRGRFGNVVASEGVETAFYGLDIGLIVRFGRR